MMQLAEGLQDRVYQQIEPAAAPALATFREQLNQLADPEQREAVSNAALAYAHALSDAALVVGWQMHADPGAWLFVVEE